MAQPAQHSSLKCSTIELSQGNKQRALTLNTAPALSPKHPVPGSHSPQTLLTFSFQPSFPIAVPIFITAHIPGLTAVTKMASGPQLPKALSFLNLTQWAFITVPGTPPRALGSSTPPEAGGPREQLRS